MDTRKLVLQISFGLVIFAGLNLGLLGFSSIFGKYIDIIEWVSREIVGSSNFIIFFYVLIGISTLITIFFRDEI